MVTEASVQKGLAGEPLRDRQSENRSCVAQPGAHRKRLTINVSRARSRWIAGVGPRHDSGNSIPLPFIPLPVRHPSFAIVMVLVAFLSAALNVLAQQTEVQFLSGHDKDDAVPWEFFCTSGANSGVWT